MKNIKNSLFSILTITLIMIFLSGYKAFGSGNLTGDTEAEQYHLAASLVLEMTDISSRDNEQDTIFKIYNSQQELVYESRDRDDTRLKQFLTRSDRLTEVGQITYYRLSQ